MTTAGTSREHTGAQAVVRGMHCQTNGIRLHYLDFNHAAPGTPILLLPGITSPAATWAFVAERLAAKRRVVVPDIRGRGLSDSGPGLGYSMDDYARDALGLIEAAGMKHPIVIGHSMGARIAARLAAMAPGCSVATGAGRSAAVRPGPRSLSDAAQLLHLGARRGIERRDGRAVPRAHADLGR